jgi:hypothetical protein
MPVTWLNVFSSHVNRVGYDDETGEMLVEWDSGKVSAYKGVPAETVESISKSPSVGAEIRDSIKPNHPHRYKE